MTLNRVAIAVLTAVTLIAAPALAAAADYHHVHITTSSPAKGVEWYSEYMECEPLADRDDAANCDGVEVVFVPQATTGGQPGHRHQPHRILVPRPRSQDGRARGGRRARFGRPAAA